MYRLFKTFTKLPDKIKHESTTKNVVHLADDSSKNEDNSNKYI